MFGINLVKAIVSSKEDAIESLKNLESSKKHLESEVEKGNLTEAVLDPIKAAITETQAAIDAPDDVDSAKVEEIITEMGAITDWDEFKDTIAEMASLLGIKKKSNGTSNGNGNGVKTKMAPQIARYCLKHQLDVDVAQHLMVEMKCPTSLMKRYMSEDDTRQYKGNSMDELTEDAEAVITAAYEKMTDADEKMEK